MPCSPSNTSVQGFSRRFKAHTRAQKTVKAQPIGKYRRSQDQTSGWTRRTMLASKILRHPYNFDFSKNKEYRAPRIAGGKKKKRIENTLLMDGSVAPSDAARGNSITANTIRGKLIVPTAPSRNRNDSQLLICTEAHAEWQAGLRVATIRSGRSKESRYTTAIYRQ